VRRGPCFSIRFYSYLNTNKKNASCPWEDASRPGAKEKELRSTGNKCVVLNVFLLITAHKPLCWLRYLGYIICGWHATITHINGPKCRLSILGPEVSCYIFYFNLCIDFYKV
jgi:hypothetical protein